LKYSLELQSGHEKMLPGLANLTVSYEVLIYAPTLPFCSNAPMQYNPYSYIPLQKNAISMHP